MSEIQFRCYRYGKIARIAVKPFGDIKWWLYFEHTESEINAQFIVDRINAEMQKRVEAIRRNAYEQGKKAARNKAQHVKHFSNCINYEKCEP